MTLLDDPVELVEMLRDVRVARRSIGLVPTMGALHAGHASLVDASHARDAVVVVSIFVNPLQFDDPSDLERYPRDLDADAALASAHGATICFVPSPSAFLGARPGEVTVDPGPIATVLEGASRPGHFFGVATIVTKLLALVAPERAYFGEKDFQQLAVVRRIASGLSFPTEIVGCPTVRDEDGLALSSRNRRLSPSARAAAPTLRSALLAGRGRLADGASAVEAEATMAEVVAAAPEVELDYAVVRDAEDLADPRRGAPVRLLIAARLDGVRLIDNCSGPSIDEGEYPASVPREPVAP